MSAKIASAFRATVVITLAAAASACVSVPDGPDIALPRAYLQDARLGLVTMSNDLFSGADTDVTDPLAEELQNGLDTCMRGHRRLDLRYHITDLRTEHVLSPDGDRDVRTLAGRAEFVDPKLKKTVGRFKIQVTTDQRMRVFADGRGVARAFASDLCQQAFGRPSGEYMRLNPAPSPPPGE